MANWINQGWANINTDLAKHLLWLGKWGDFTILDEAWNPIRVEKDILRLTKFDLSSIPKDATDDDIINFINGDLGVDIRTPEWLESLNRSFQTAISLYGNLKIRKIFERKGASYNLISKMGPFKDVQDVLQFIKEWSTDSWDNRLSCLIAKITSAVHDYTTGSLSELSVLDNDFKSCLFWALGITENPSWNKTYEWHILGNKFTVFGEPKTQASSVGKSLENPKYHSSESILDGIRYTFELDSKNKEDLLKSLWHVFNVIESFPEDFKIESIDNKWIISEWDNFSDIVNIHLQELLNKAKWSKKKTHTHYTYQEIKIKWRYKWRGFEIKFTLQWNKNQEAWAFQWLYAYANKYIGQIIRVASDWYITSEEIEEMAKEFYDDIPNLIAINPEIRLHKSEDDLKEELWKYFQENKLIISRMNMRDKGGRIRSIIFIKWVVEEFKKKLYTVKLANGEVVWTNARWFELAQQWIYPEMDRRITKNGKDRTKGRRSSDTSPSIF